MVRLSLVTSVVCLAALAFGATKNEPYTQLQGSKTLQRFYRNSYRSIKSNTSIIQPVHDDLTPPLTPKGVPVCKPTFLGPSAYCEEDDSYPMDEVKKMMQNLTIQLDYRKKPLHDYDDTEIMNLCPTRRRELAPKTAMNTKKQWRFVVNGPGQEQIISAEVCTKPDSSCSYISEALPYGYSSKCAQKYSTISLLSIDPRDGRVVSDSFIFASCCVCRAVKEFSFSTSKKPKSKKPKKPKKPASKKPKKPISKKPKTPLKPRQRSLTLTAH